MRRFLTLSLVALLAFVSVANGAGDSIPLLGAGGTKKTGAAYTGPGDVVASASHFYGLRAYSAASIGGNSVRLRRDGGSAGEQDFITVASGLVDAASITSFCAGVNCFLVTYYDQVGSDHLTQATTARQPLFSPTGGPGGAFPAPQCVEASNHFLATAGSVTVAQPLTWSIVAMNTVNDTTNQMIVTGTGSSLEIYFSDTDNRTGMFAGTTGVTHTGATQGNYISIHAIANGASSVLVNNASASGSLNPGTTGQGGAINMCNFGPNVVPADAKILEAGIWPVAFNSTQYGNMHTNQSTFWGY